MPDFGNAAIYEMSFTCCSPKCRTTPPKPQQPTALISSKSEWRKSRRYPTGHPTCQPDFAANSIRRPPDQGQLRFCGFDPGQGADRCCGNMESSAILGRTICRHFD